MDDTFFDLQNPKPESNTNGQYQTSESEQSPNAINDILQIGDKYPLRRLLRIHWNHKHKKRDRFKHRAWNYIRGHWKHDHSERDYEFGRIKTATELPNGVAYDIRSDSEFF